MKKMREESSVLCAKLEALREKRGFPGITGAVVTADGREFIASAGLADPDAKVAMPPDAVMLQASVGKMYLGAIARVLSDQGVVALDAPVSHYLNSRPWFVRLPNHGTMQ